MTIYLPNTGRHETGAEVDEFMDVLILDPPPPTPAQPPGSAAGEPGDRCEGREAIR
jgi:hypothetical protein